MIARKEDSMSKEVYTFKETFHFGSVSFDINHDGLLVGLKFIDHDEQIINQMADTPIQVQEIRELLIKQLDLYGQGSQKKFAVPMRVHGTAYQLKVWEMLKEIPYGQWTTYGDIARGIAESKGQRTFSAQAAGQAIKSNPIAILIPCHRVLGKNQLLTGYAGGIDKKINLLKLEGIEYK